MLLSNSSDRPSSTTTRPLWVHAVSTQQVIAAGLRTLIAEQAGPELITFEGPEDGEPDVVLYDVIGLFQGDGSDLDHWVKETGSTVVAVMRELRPDLGAIALDRGAEAGVSVGASPAELLEVLMAAANGTLDESPAAQEAEDSTRLGHEAGLSPREADILRMIVAGLSNDEIARTAYLSINSVKTYIRSLYRKMEITNRAQAVAWGMQHGFPADLDAQRV